MVEFLKSKRTSFVNKPVGVVAADTGARQLGLSIAEFGNSMQKIFWEEARQDAVKGDIEKANTLAIRDEQGKLKFERPNFTDVGGGKANAILRERYGNDILIKSKQRFGELHAEYTKDGKFDKEGFDLAAQSYIKGHTDSFKENGFEEFIPAFLSKVQNQAVLHSNKILNDKIDQENRIANENEKIIIDEQIQELEGLYYNASSISTRGVDEEEDRTDLQEDIRESEKEILQRIESLKGKPNGLAAPAIKELKRKMRINSSLGVLQSIVDKNPNDDKAIKMLEMAFQGNTITSDQRAYLLLSNNAITESDLLEASRLKDKFNYTYSDRATVSGILSNYAGDAAAINQKLSESMKALNSSVKIQSEGFHTDSKPSREEFQLGLQQKYGSLDLRSFLTMPKDKYEAVLADLRTSTILPQSLYEAFKNTNIMAMFEGMPMQSRQTVAAKLLNTWNNISKRQDVNGFVSSRYPSQYNDIEKKFAIIKKITDIGGADYILPAYEIAMMSPENTDDANKLIMAYNEKFDLNATKPADVINALLTESDIDKQFHQEYFSFTKALLFAGKLKDSQGKSVEFSKDNIVEVLNDTFKNLHEEDDDTFQLFGNVLGGRTNVSYKNHYKNEGSRKFFIDHVNNLLETRRTFTPEMMETATQIEVEDMRAGNGGNVKFMPDYRNTGGGSMTWTLVDEDKVPVLGFDGTPIQVNTQDVDRSLQIHLIEQNKAILAKNFRSTQLTDDNINQLINSVNASPNIMEIRGIGEQYYGINPQLDEALVNKGYRVSGPMQEDEVDKVTTVPEENIFTLGLNKLLGFFQQQSFNITADNIKKNFPELGSKGTQNPAWRYVYNQVVQDNNVPKELKKAIDENFDEDVAIQIVDDSVDVLSYLGNIEGFKPYGYKDGVGKNATISIGAGFNLNYFTDEDMATLSDKGKAHVTELKGLLKKYKSGQISLEDIEDYSKKQGESITEVESQQIFRNKVLDIYKKFTNEFPNFTTLHSDRQKALIDHAYQMGYGQGKFKKYWKEVSAALKTTNPRNRDYHFMMAGSHLLYNYNNESQEGMSNTFVTGETILNKQFQSYGPIGNDRIYDRAELLGYVDRNRPSFIDKAMVLGGKVYNRAASEIRKM
jgi:hypothetical protein